jgi:peptidoglycan hydrolase-like protein with peptidoglycan-binding domain
MSSMELLEAVGAKGSNRKIDVALVQSLLNSKGFKAGRVDGVCGAKTVDAIRKFQASFLQHPDGLIEPRHLSWVKLIAPGGMSEAPHLAQWTGDSARWSQEKKLLSMHPDLRPRVMRLLAGLAKRGFQPTIFFGWRSVAVQLDIFKRGHTKVKFSFHNAQLKDGTPNAYAADIIDSRYAWTPESIASGFWTALGEEARAQKLFWGGDWKTFQDWAHVQLVDNPQLGRVRIESGL